MNIVCGYIKERPIEENVKTTAIIESSSTGSDEQLFEKEFIPLLQYYAFLLIGNPIRSKEIQVYPRQLTIRLVRTQMKQY